MAVPQAARWRTAVVKKINLFLIAASLSQLLFLSELRAEALKGYPYEALSSIRKYNCVETEIIESKHGQPIIYDLCIDRKFSAAGENILRQGFQAFMKGLTSENVYQCISHTNKPKTFTLFQRAFLEEPFSVRKVSTFLTNSNTFISALDRSYKNIFSAGYLNFYEKPQFDSQKQGWRKYTSIAIRQDLVGNPSHPLGSEYQFWAVQIALSIFKNLGFKEETSAHHYPSLSQDFARCLLKSFRGDL